jgi:starch phosphorylase
MAASTARSWTAGGRRPHEESLGWSIGDATGGPADEVDERDAASLFETLENRVVPEFYNRDADGLPRDWLQRIRRSMSVLTPAFASSRMMLEYIEKAYLPLAAGIRSRLADNCSLARDLHRWSVCLRLGWPSVHIGQPTFLHSDGRFRCSVPVFLGEMQADFVRVELFADEIDGLSAEVITLYREQAIPGSAHGYVYAGEVAGSRAAEEYTLRVVPWHEAVRIPAELPLIVWQR